MLKKTDRFGLRTWLEIDRQAIKHNYQTFRSLLSTKTKFLAVVKSNAYGHNLVEFAMEQVKLGVDYLAVDSVVEGLTLRREGLKIPILILGYTLPEMLVLAVENDLEISVSNFEYFKEFKKLKLSRLVKIHIKVDTGMHRHGFNQDEIAKVLTAIKSLAKNKNLKIKVVGLYTHFASAKNPAFPGDTLKQIAVFKQWSDAFSKAGIKCLRHAGATSGTILYPNSHFDMVRVGIGLYGIWPSRESKAFVNNKFTLKTVLSWRTVVAEIRTLSKGDRVGYDFTETMNKQTRVSVLPIGYWHGLPRALSGIGEVLINGQRAKILGRVCMDIVMVEVTDIKKVKIGDVATVIGVDGREKISVDDIATLLDGSSYEIVTRLNPLIKRIYK